MAASTTSMTQVGVSQGVAGQGLVCTSSTSSSFKGSSLSNVRQCSSDFRNKQNFSARCSLEVEKGVLPLSRRNILISSTAFAPLIFANSAFALLEEDDDESLLEKVKKDRQDKIQKRTSRGSYKEEAASIQKAVYKLSKTGQFLDDSDYAAASVLLGSDLSTAWIKDAQEALAKVSSSSEENSIVQTFSSSLANLQAAVLKDDVETAKSSFVASAGALEKWTTLTGLREEILGL